MYGVDRDVLMRMEVATWIFGRSRSGEKLGTTPEIGAIASLATS